MENMNKKSYIKCRGVLALISLFLIGLLFISIFFDTPCEIGNIGDQCAIFGIVFGIYTVVFVAVCTAIILINIRKKKQFLINHSS